MQANRGMGTLKLLSSSMDGSTFLMRMRSLQAGNVAGETLR